MEPKAPHQKKCSKKTRAWGERPARTPAKALATGWKGSGSSCASWKALERRRLPTWKVMKAPTMAESRGMPWRTFSWRGTLEFQVKSRGATT
jgi:hypothetical protein